MMYRGRGRAFIRRTAATYHNTSYGNQFSANKPFGRPPSQRFQRSFYPHSHSSHGTYPAHEYQHAEPSQPYTRRAGGHGGVVVEFNSRNSDSKGVGYENTEHSKNEDSNGSGGLRREPDDEIEPGMIVDSPRFFPFTWKKQ